MSCSCGPFETCPTCTPMTTPDGLTAEAIVQMVWGDIAKAMKSEGIKEERAWAWADAIALSPLREALERYARHVRETGCGRSVLCASCRHGHDEPAWSANDPNDGTCWATQGPLVCGCPKFITEAVSRIRLAAREEAPE